jgi:hypothetical protein
VWAGPGHTQDLNFSFLPLVERADVKETPEPHHPCPSRPPAVTGGFPLQLQLCVCAIKVRVRTV